MSFRPVLTKLSRRKGMVRASPPVLGERDQTIKAICEASFYAFVREAWPHVEGNEYRDGWHVEAICRHLEALREGRITRLLQNQPPRTSKSTIVAVMYPAWLFALDPSDSVMCVSYSKQLTVRDSTKCRRLMQSAWYQKLWPEVKFNEDENQKTFFSLTRGGYRIATSTGASTTGMGANFIICDDLDNIAEIRSKLYRENNITYFREVLQTRHAGDPKRLRMVVVQQRCHESDCSGSILSSADSRWVHLRLPMEFEADDRCETIPLYNPYSGKMEVWSDPRTQDGEILWPEMLSKADVRNLKERDFRGDGYIIAGQLQQRPAPRGGGVFRNEWFKVWPERDLPPLDYVVSSWDTALAVSTDSAFSTCVTLGVFKNAFNVQNAILLSLWQERVEFPELKAMALRLYMNCFDTDRLNPASWRAQFQPDVVLVEGKVSGFSLLQELGRMSIPALRFDPSRYGDKESRARRVADVIEMGMVWLNRSQRAPDIPDGYGQALLKETSVFPAGEYMDVVDAFSQALIHLKERNVLYLHGQYMGEAGPLAGMPVQTF